MTSDLSDPEKRIKFAAVSNATILMNELDSRPEGHYNEEVTTSRIKFGDNTITNHNKYIILKRLRRAFVNIFIVSLITIGILWLVCSILQGEKINWVYISVLATLVIINGSMVFIQETRSENAAAKLISMVTTIITLRRENVEIEVDSADLVVGDIIILDAGDTVPADVRIIKSNHLKVDQSVLTGESSEVTKTDTAVDDEKHILECSNIAFMGSNVISGSAEAVVIAVGDDTVFGLIANKLTRNKNVTSYDKGNKAIIKILTKLMAYTIPIIAIIMLTRGYLDESCFTYQNIQNALIFSVTLAIGLMPEMLATIVSTNLAKGAMDMSKKKVIVKDMTSIQNLGAMDILCSDKTGTLTQNRISVMSCNDIHGNNSHMAGLFICLNSKNLTSSTNQIDWAINNYAEECALADELELYPYVADIPFDFFRRRATVVVKQDDKVNIMITKGATPEMLSISTGYLDENREIRVLDDKTRNGIMGLVEWYSEKGMRVLGVGYRYFPTTKKEFTKDDEYELIYVGFVVFSDPIKNTAKNAIADMKKYGIITKVLTGDNEYVARYVTNEIGIVSSDVILGPNIDKMSDKELRDAVEKFDIFVRLTPNNKSRIVQALRTNGHTVGLMGDGINDVAAMKTSDISISVDTGTDIARDTAQMILLEKDLNILKDGAIEGRKVHANTIKYIKMIGSANFGYMLSLILATLLFDFSPMGAMMILVFNLINDIACIAIPWDNVEDEFVRKPCRWDITSIKNTIFRYGPLYLLTDIITWMFIIFVLFTVASTQTNEVISGMAMIFDNENIRNTSFEVMFQSFWCIEQYWVQVWVIHVVRTNKVPFFQSQPSKILIIATIVALIIGTGLPFIEPIWTNIAGIEGLKIPLWSLIWMPFIACVFLSCSHLIKRYMLKTFGYFAC
ncbi:MAG: magnesium-translocating P-type ATPase [archaeon]|nr:magnesium-translocating P-type ATPase [archaeon]